MQDEVAHLVDERLQARLLQLGFNDISDQRQHLRLRFEQLSLRARVLHQLDREPLHFIVRKVLFDQLFCSSRVHNNPCSAMPVAYCLLQCPSIAPPALPMRRAAIMSAMQTTLTISASEHIGPRLPST